MQIIAAAPSHEKFANGILKNSGVLTGTETPIGVEWQWVLKFIWVIIFVIPTASLVMGTCN
jgi:hypothetical protein